MKIICAKCNCILESKHLDKHMKYSHGILTGFAYSCPDVDCGRNFSTAKTLHNHARKLNHVLSIEKEGVVQENLPIAETVRSTQFLDHFNSIHLQTDTSNCKIDPKKIDLHNELLHIISALYADTSLARVHVQKFLDYTQNFVQSSFENFFKHICLKYFKDEITKKEIQKEFENLSLIFEPFNTEHKRINQLVVHKGLIQAEEKLLGYREVNNRLGFIENIQTTCQFVPLRKTLKAFMQIPNVFNIIQKSINTSNSTSISNIVHSRYWKKQTENIDGLVLPLFIYQDDFETGNSLGSRATIHKLSAIYANIACLPLKYFSKLDNIFLVQLHYSSDADYLGNSCVFKYLKEELNYLSNNGVIFNNQGEEVVVRFQLAMVLGDNLGLNSILGFSRSFSATSYCRFCKMPKSICQKSFKEDTKLLRTKLNYNSDLLKQDSKSTGISENSIFNSVEKFHVCENLCVDVMHDLLEGLCKTDLINILNHFIEEKIFTLETLNSKIQWYKYPRNSNKPSIITSQNLKDKKLRMSAAEMMVFTLHAGLIFGDLIPDDTDEYWELYKLLRQILVICLKSVISTSLSYLLSTLIEEHHSLHFKLIGDLTPKSHFCLHYPRIMRLVGPPRNFWTMRFEGKHRIFKQAARVTCNRQNLCLTLASRHQEHLSYAFANGLAFKETLKYKNLKHTKISEKCLKIINTENLEEFSLIAHILIGNVLYKINTFIVVRIDDQPIFGCIKNILLMNNAEPVKTNDFKLIVEVYETLGKSEHLQTYVIPRLGQTTMELLNFESIIHFDIPHVPYANVKSEINVIYD